MSDATASYLTSRERIETYFDRTAAEAWRQLTSDAPLSGVRASVRAGRDQMRLLLLSWLPADLRGARLLDAGCGTGALAVAAARRGADVVAVDLAANLVNVAQERAPGDLAGRVTFVAGDMLNPALGGFDYVIAMDSLIHYRPADARRAAQGLAERARYTALVTFAPHTPALMLKRGMGKLFPRANRSPEIVPVAPEAHMRALRAGGLRTGRTERVASSFYISQALELAT